MVHRKSIYMGELPWIRGLRQLASLRGGLAKRRGGVSKGGDLNTLVKQFF